MTNGDLVVASFFADYYAPPDAWQGGYSDDGAITHTPEGEPYVVRAYVAHLLIPYRNVRKIARRLVDAAEAVEQAVRDTGEGEQSGSTAS